MNFENQYIELFRNSPVCIHEIDLDAKLTSMNPAGLDMLDIKSESDIIGLDYFSAVSKEDQKTIKAHFKSALEGESVMFEFQSPNDNGMVKHYRSNFIPIKKDGKVIKIMGISEDVTDSTYLIDDLRQSERKYRDLIESMGEGIIHIDLEEVILFVNDALCSITGFSREELIGKIASEMLLIRDEDIATIKADLKQRTEGLSSRRELMIRKKDGDLRWLLSSGSPMTDSKGKVIGSLGIVQDITDKVKSDQKLRSLNIELETFIYKASHDLRGPISSTIGLLQLIEDDPDLDAQKKYLGLIKLTVQKLDDIIIAFTKIGKIQQGDFELEQIKIKPFIDEVITLLGHGYNETPDTVKFILDIDENLKVRSYSDLLINIVQNLIENAVKYSAAKPDNIPEIKIVAWKESHGIMLTINDNGIGIRNDLIPKIFDMFYRATEKSQGSGLGLYLVKNAINKLEGWVNVQSVENEGTKFTVYIPNYLED